MNKSTIFLNICILIIVVFSSCQSDEAPQPDQTPGIKLIPLLLNAPASGGGGTDGNAGDDDGDIIQGRVQNSSQQTLTNASVQLIDGSNGQVTASDVTDAAGNFNLPAQAGNYNFEVTASGYTTQQTDSLFLDGTVYTVIELQE